MTIRQLLPVAVLTSGLLGILSSCGGSSSNEIEYIPAQISEGGAWVFIDAEGKRVGTQQWEFEPTVTRGNIFTARTDSGLTVYRWSGSEARPVDSLQNLVSVGVCNDGLLPVVPAMQRIRIVDTDGNVKFVLDPIGGKEVTSCALGFNDGMLTVTTVDGKTGVVDSKGKVVVEPKYSEISNYSGGYALAANYDFNDGSLSYFILDKEGKVTPVKGKYSNGEGECFNVPEFDHGEATIYTVADSTTYELKNFTLTTDGKTTPAKNDGFTMFLENGGKIVNTFKDDKSSSVMFGTDGKQLLSANDGEFLNPCGNFVLASSEKQTVLYNDKGQKLDTFEGSWYGEAVGGKFGAVLSQWTPDGSKFKLLDPAGKPVEGLDYAAYGTKTYPSQDNDNAEVECVAQVTSAYVDITAASAKIASMVSGNGVKGKDYYFLGQQVSDILAGDNARFYSGGDRNFSIPTDSTGQIASGAGFWIGGSGKASAAIVAPTYQHYFEVHHYDYYGRAWGWNRKRQTGVHFNTSARVVSFDLQLHTNHPSGEQLRESIARHMRKNGFTVVKNAPNYDEYTNGGTNVIIYGSRDSHGVGALVSDKAITLRDDEKAALAASLY